MGVLYLSVDNIIYTLHGNTLFLYQSVFIFVCRLSENFNLTVLDVFTLNSIC